MDSLELQMSLPLAHLFQLGDVDLGGGPGRSEELHPPFGFETPEHAERVLFVDDLLGLVAALEVGGGGDVALFLAGLVAGLGLFVHLPAEPGHEADGADHADGVLDKAVVADEAELAIFDVGDAVEGVHEQAVGALVEGERHGVGGEVAAAEVVEDGGGLDDGFAGLGIGDAEGAAQLEPDIAGKTQEERLAGNEFSGYGRAKFLNIFL
jgi:hypothetical protein